MLRPHRSLDRSWMSFGVSMARTTVTGQSFRCPALVMLTNLVRQVRGFDPRIGVSKEKHTERDHFLLSRGLLFCLFLGWSWIDSLDTIMVNGFYKVMLCVSTLPKGFLKVLCLFKYPKQIQVLQNFEISAITQLLLVEDSLSCWAFSYSHPPKIGFALFGFSCSPSKVTSTGGCTPCRCAPPKPSRERERRWRTLWTRPMNMKLAYEHVKEGASYGKRKSSLKKVCWNGSLESHLVVGK